MVTADSASMRIELTERQRRFIECDCDEVLYGGAAGGGKSYAQLCDALIYALKYAGSKQLILRRTYPELERSLIRVSRELYPSGICDFNGRAHCYQFINGSIIEFGSCEYERDVYKYQSAEYDVIRFDELTHFTEYQYLYLISRVRGTSGYPKQIKSATNPGGIGHSWVRARFIDAAPPETVIRAPSGNRIFIPARVTDNVFLMRRDPNYLTRLKALPKRERRALLEGAWDIEEGRFFSELDRERHVIIPFAIPHEWKKWRVIDYGLDRLVCLWIAADTQAPPCFYVYRELCASDLIISEASERILAASCTDQGIVRTIAPPDLWGRSQETGRSRATIFADSGLKLSKCSNDRASGWMMIRELMRPDLNGNVRLKFFNCCHELISCLSQICIDPSRPDDVMTEPHRLTHAPDALRYFVSYYRSVMSAACKKERPGIDLRSLPPDMLEDIEYATPTEREYLLNKWGTHQTI